MLIQVLSMTMVLLASAWLGLNIVTTTLAPQRTSRKALSQMWIPVALVALALLLIHQGVVAQVRVCVGG